MNQLQHFGVKGMKWGVRRDRPSSKNGPPARFGTLSKEDRAKAAKYVAVISAGGMGGLGAKTVDSLFGEPLLGRGPSKSKPPVSKADASASDRARKKVEAMTPDVRKELDKFAGGGWAGGL